MIDATSRYFPTPLAGEFIYGTYVRWCTLNPRARKLKLGLKAGNILLDFEGLWLRALSDAIGIDITSNQTLLSESSLLPLHNSFYSSQKQLTPSMSGKYSVRTEKSYRHLKFCPVCAMDDQKSTGFAYWRVAHQSPLVLRCSIHEVQFIYLEGTHFTFGRPTSLDINNVLARGSLIVNSFSQQELTPFQSWIEKLETSKVIYQKRNLAHTIISAVRESIGFSSLPTSVIEKRLKASPARDVLVNSIKDSGYENYLLKGTRSKSELKSSSLLSIYKLLSYEKRYSPVLYLLLAWTFLTPKVLKSIIGKTHA